MIRFSGSLDARNLETHLATLTRVLADAKRKTLSAPVLLGYDPPFTIPALRRNEIALDVEP